MYVDGFEYLEKKKTEMVAGIVWRVYLEEGLENHYQCRRCVYADRHCKAENDLDILCCSLEGMVQVVLIA